MIVMPPIEWPTSTSGPSGASARITASRSRPELLDRAALPRRRARSGRGCAGRRARGARGGSAELGEAAALEVPGAAVEGESVHEHDGELGGSSRRVAGGVDLLARRAARRRRRSPRTARRAAARRAPSTPSDICGGQPAPVRRRSGCACVPPRPTATPGRAAAPTTPPAPPTVCQIPGFLTCPPTARCGSRGAMHAGDDLVVDGAELVGPVLRGRARRRRPGRTAPPVSPVADVEPSPQSTTTWSMQTRPTTGRSSAAEQHPHPAAAVEPPRHAVGVPERARSASVVSDGRRPLVAVGHALARPAPA